MATKYGDRDVQIRACIYRGVALLLGASALLVTAATFAPGLNAAVKEVPFVVSTFAIYGAGVLLSLVTAFVGGAITQKTVFALLFVGLNMLLMIVSAYGNANAVIASLVTAMLIIAAASYVGGRIGTDTRSWGPLLVGGLLLVLLAELLNAFVFQASAFEVALSTVAIVLFTAFTVYDVDTHSRGYCRFNCCLEGAFDVWINFANIFLRVQELMD